MRLKELARFRRRDTFALCASVAVALLLLTNCLNASAQNAAGPVVKVTGGSVQGRLLTAPGGAVFQGIPFAAPPVGDLRWRETQPVKPWTGVHPAVEYAATCMQGNSGWNKNSADKASEDCLYLNVWAPEWPSKTKKAVMVWMHGGGNGGGSALGAGTTEPPFDAEKLVADRTFSQKIR